MKSFAEILKPIQNLNIIRHILSDDGVFPNNTLLPLLIYREAIHLPESKKGKTVKEVFESNGWTNSWEDTILDVHHYHSTTHEVLCVTNGSARIQFGGPSGISVMVDEGDVIIIPAGVAHKNIGGDDDFECVGAYPDGRDYDMNYGKKGERPRADENIKQLPLPTKDPVYGVDGPLIKNWETIPDKIAEIH